MAAGAIGDRVYVAGGRFGAGFSSEFTGVLEVYDTISGAWSTGAPMLTPRTGNNGITVGDCLYTWGGEFSGGVLEENEVYHAPTDTWRVLAPMPTPIHGVVGAGYRDGRVYAPGGGTARGGSSGSLWHQVFATAGTCP